MGSSTALFSLKTRCALRIDGLHFVRDQLRVLGSFIVVRKMALFGDTLSHAVLPGVALGFMWNMSKDPLAIFIGATLAGLIGGALVTLIVQTTRLKEDTALGLVAFFLPLAFVCSHAFKKDFYR